MPTLAAGVMGRWRLFNAWMRNRPPFEVTGVVYFHAFLLLIVLFYLYIFHAFHINASFTYLLSVTA